MDIDVRTAKHPDEIPCENTLDQHPVAFFCSVWITFAAIETVTYYETSEMLTGEPLYIEKTAGATVTGATLNTIGSLTVRILCAGDRFDVHDVVSTIDLSKAIMRKIMQNFVWAPGYNVIAIPLAMAGFIRPEISGAAMVLPSVSIVTGSLLLKRF